MTMPFVPASTHSTYPAAGVRPARRAGGGRAAAPTRRPGGMRAAGCLIALALVLAGFASPLAAQAGVPEELRTHAERSGWTELTPHDEVLGFYRALARHAPDEVRLRSIGTSREGRELLAVTISRPGVSGPSDPHVRGRPIVFIGAQVHGNEQAGKEGLMLFARDLAVGASADLLEHAVFVLVPQINPDAGEAGTWGTRTNPAGYNVNRDYSRLVNPESRAVVEQVLNPWQPHVTVDAHELTGAHYYDFFALHPSTLYTPTAVREMAAGPATEAVRSAIEGAGYTYFPYHLLPSDPTLIPEEGISGAGYGIRILRNYGGARGAVSLLYESRRDEDARLRLEERARWQRIAMEGLSRWVAENAADVVAAVEEGRAEMARLGARWDPADSIVVRTRLEVSGTVAYRSPEMRALPDGSGFEPTGRILDLEVPFRDRIVPVVARIRPVGYLIEAHRGDLAEALLRHGLEVERIEGPLETSVESFRVDSIAVASSTAEGYYERSVWTTTEVRTLSLPRGGYLVRATQPMAGVAFALLEPEDVDSFASEGAFAAEKSVGGTLPVHRLRELPRAAGVLLPAPGGGR